MAVLATAIWRVRPSGNNVNGGGYDPGIAGAATDYSQQNSAQASGSNGTATGTTTFVDATANAFTSAMIGNAIWIASGAGFTVGAYFVTAFTSASTVTLDRSPGTGTVAVWKLGGGWADFWTNTVASSTNVVPGNTIFILGSGTPNPSSYTFDYTLTTANFLVIGSSSASIVWANDPGTPGYVAPPSTVGGMPVIRVSGTGAFKVGNFCYSTFQGLWFVANSATLDTGVLLNLGASVIYGCVFDQNGFDTAVVGVSGNDILIGCEVFSSVAPISTSTRPAVGDFEGFASWYVDKCNIHDTVGPGISMGAQCTLTNSIIAKCHSDGIAVIDNSYTVFIMNNTIDGNTGNGITCNKAPSVAIMSNIISNHTGGGKAGIAVSTAITGIVDFNIYYNNTTDISGSSYGPHDTHGGSNPYVGQSTENYTLA
jgi:hypothetical protein